MALIKCPECGKEISDKAASCPNCGCPVHVEDNAPEAKDGNIQETSEVPKKKKGGRGILKIIIVIFAILVILVIIGSVFGGESNTSEEGKIPTSSESSDEKVYLTDEEIPQLFSDPDQFKGKYVKLTGKVFVEPEDTGDYIGLQVWNDPDNAANNFLVKAPKDGTEYNSESYVIVDGKIEGEVTGTNIVGGEVNAPMIAADKVEISDYKTVVRPTIKEYTFESLGADQYGYSVSVTKVEFAEQETRVYATVKNNGGSKFSVFGYSAKLIQGGQQYEIEANYNADYPELQSEVLPGTESSGVLVFQATDPNTDFQVYIEGYSDNWEESIQPYQLSATIQGQ